MNNHEEDFQEEELEEEEEWEDEDEEEEENDLERKRAERRERREKKKNSTSVPILKWAAFEAIPSKRLLQIIAVLLILTVLQSCAEYWIPPTYKYKVVHVGNNIDAVVNKHAEDGWELHEITGLLPGDRSAILKKRGWWIGRFF